MEGKGWFVIYGILALLVIYLIIAQQLHAGKIKQLEADLAQQNTTQTVAPVPTDSPNAEPTPDLSNAAGRDSQRAADLAAISAALKEYQAAKKSYPNSLQQLVPDYLASLPKDPLSPRYNYRYVKTSTGYRLTAYLETSDYPDDRDDGKQDHILTVTEKSS